MDPDAKYPAADSLDALSDSSEPPVGLSGFRPPAPSLEGAGRPPAPRLEGAAPRISGVGPLSDRSILAEQGRERLRQGVLIRPLRLLPVGREVPFTVADQQFLEHMEQTRAPVVYLSPCPKRQTGSAC